MKQYNIHNVLKNIFSYFQLFMEKNLEDYQAQQFDYPVSILNVIYSIGCVVCESELGKEQIEQFG